MAVSAFAEPAGSVLAGASGLHESREAYESWAKENIRTFAQNGDLLNVDRAMASGVIPLWRRNEALKAAVIGERADVIGRILTYPIAEEIDSGMGPLILYAIHHRQSMVEPLVENDRMARLENALDLALDQHDGRAAAYLRSMGARSPGSR